MFCELICFELYTYLWKGFKSIALDSGIFISLQFEIGHWKKSQEKIFHFKQVLLDQQKKWLKSMCRRRIKAWSKPSNRPKHTSINVIVPLFLLLQQQLMLFYDIHIHSWTIVNLVTDHSVSISVFNHQLRDTNVLNKSVLSVSLDWLLDFSPLNC